MKLGRIGLVLVAVGVGLSLATSFAADTTVRIRAVRLNGEAITPTSSLDVRWGDIIEAEIFVSDWCPPDSSAGSFQIMLDTDALIDQPGLGRCGSIKPLNYDIPELRLTGFFINITWMGRGVCSRESANAGVSCVSRPFPCTDGNCVDGVCYGGANAGRVCATGENQCDGGACVDHPDFIFQGIAHPICAVATWPHYRLGCTLFLEDGPVDASRCVGGSADGASCVGDGDCPGGTCEFVEYYTGTVVLEVGPDAGGTFLVDVVPYPATFVGDPAICEEPWPYFPLTLNVRAGVVCDDFRGACCLEPGRCRKMDEWDCIDGGGVFLGSSTDCADHPHFCVCPTIVDAMPANCAIDARYPQPSRVLPGRELIGFETVEVTLSADAETNVPSPDDFRMSFVGGGVAAPPVVTAVTPLGGTTVRLDFDKPFPLQRWTCLSMACAPASSMDVCWGHLPGDVNGDGVANAVDILDLIDATNGVRPMPLQWYQCDVDDSGSCNPADVLGVVDLLNGASTFAAWNNVTMSGGRCPTEP